MVLVSIVHLRGEGKEGGEGVEKERRGGEERRWGGKDRKGEGRRGKGKEEGKN